RLDGDCEVRRLGATGHCESGGGTEEKALNLHFLTSKARSRGRFILPKLSGGPCLERLRSQSPVPVRVDLAHVPTPGCPPGQPRNAGPPRSVSRTLTKAARRATTKGDFEAPAAAF